MTEQFAIGLDIGGTKIGAGLVDTSGQIVERRRSASPKSSFDALRQEILRIVAELSRDQQIGSVGIGVAGYVDRTRSSVMFSPHLPLRGQNLRVELEAALGLPVVVENDANAAGWAEAQFGAAMGAENVVMVTIGTGLGGAILSGGKLNRGSFGMAGEFGHQRFAAEARACECGNSGCWEQFVSGRVLARKAAAAVLAGEPIGDALVELAGSAEAVAGETVSALASSGDPTAISWLGEMGSALGIGLANIAAVLDPEVFVIGGGVSEADELLLAPARAAFADHLTGRGHRRVAPIVRARFANDAGIIGAGDLSRR